MLVEVADVNGNIEVATVTEMQDAFQLLRNGGVPLGGEHKLVLSVIAPCGFQIARVTIPMANGTTLILSAKPISMKTDGTVCIYTLSAEPEDTASSAPLLW